MRTLKEIFSEIGHFGSDVGHNDKGGTHSYLETYEELFSKKRNGASLLEIGIAFGKSIELFDEYFENSKIVGVDLSIVFEPKEYKNNVELIVSDGTKPELLNKLGGQKFDIVIDDGSHMENDQVNTFNMLKGSMNAGGVYIIEDILALDSNRKRFMALHPNCEIVDLRTTKGRFDDVLIIYRF